MLSPLLMQIILIHQILFWRFKLDMHDNFGWVHFIL